jgi:hypothetical protein
MGDIADMMLEGDLCQECGEYMEGGGGFPRTCYGCSPKSKPKKTKKPPEKGVVYVVFNKYGKPASLMVCEDDAKEFCKKNSVKYSRFLEAKG